MTKTTERASAAIEQDLQEEIQRRDVCTQELEKLDARNSELDEAEGEAFAAGHSTEVIDRERERNLAEARKRRNALPVHERKIAELRGEMGRAKIAEMEGAAKRAAATAREMEAAARDLANEFVQTFLPLAGKVEEAIAGLQEANRVARKTGGEEQKINASAALLDLVEAARSYAVRAGTAAGRKVEADRAARRQERIERDRERAERMQAAESRPRALNLSDFDRSEIEQLQTSAAVSGGQ